MCKFLFFIAIFIHSVFAIGAAAPEEYILAETDRDIYIAGEHLLFSVSVISPGNDNPLSNVCYLVLRNSKNVVSEFYIKTNDYGSGGSVYLPDTLKTGYYELVAFTNYMRNFGEDHYYRKQIIIVNRFDEWLTGLNEGGLNESNSPAESDLSISLTTDKEIYGLREKVTVSLNPGSNLKLLSIAVKETNSYSSAYFKRDQTQFPSNLPEIKFEPETSGIFLYGKLTSQTVPAANKYVFISTPDSFANLQYSFTNSNGGFSFILNGYYAGKELVISTRENFNGNCKITIENKFELRKPFVPQKIKPDSALRKYIFESQKIVRIAKAYNFNYLRSQTVDDSKIPVPYVYRNPGRVIVPQNFITLDNFGEIANNIVPGYRVRTNDGTTFGYHINPADGLFFNEPGAVFLNGVYIYTLNPVNNFSSEDVTKIEVCDERRIKGRISFPGVISIITDRIIDYNSILPDSRIVRMDKFLENTVYAPPRYEKTVGHDPLPDFRQTLFWRACPKTEDLKVFSFYTSDWPSNYTVEVNAVTPEGKRVRSFTSIKVKKP